jgi:hypothetical protein
VPGCLVLTVAPADRELIAWPDRVQPFADRRVIALFHPVRRPQRKIRRPPKRAPDQPNQIR